jgi:ribosomal protein S24E
MKITIQEKKENPLLNRTELKGGIEFNDITPSNVKLAESLAKETKKDINLVVVKSIYTHFGQKLADFEAIVYDNKEAKDKIEMLTKHIKKKMEEDRKSAEEAKTAAKEAAEKPAEEKKEETPVEETTESKDSEPAPEEQKKEEPAAEEAKEEPVKETPAEKPVEKAE